MISLKRERVTTLLVGPYLDGLDCLIKEGIYLERQSAIRAALRFLMERYGIPPFYQEAKDDEHAVTAS